MVCSLKLTSIQEKLGKEYKNRNEKLCSIISSIEEKLVDFSTNNDTLGDAYEYLIAQFASGSGKKRVSFILLSLYQRFYLVS